MQYHSSWNLATIIGLGVARFAFISLLSSMLEEHLSISFAGVLASVNYVGYLAGAIFVCEVAVRASFWYEILWQNSWEILSFFAILCHFIAFISCLLAFCANFWDFRLCVLDEFSSKIR